MSCKPTRREFIQLSSAATALWAAGSPLEAIAGPFEPSDVADDFVPVDKKLKPEWVKAFVREGPADVVRRKRSEHHRHAYRRDYDRAALSRG